MVYSTRHSLTTLKRASFFLHFDVNYYLLTVVLKTSPRVGRKDVKRGLMVFDVFPDKDVRMSIIL